MEQWREYAIRLFPDLRGLYSDDEETIWFVLSDQLNEVRKAHRAGDINRLERIYEFAEWCFLRRDIQPEIWQAAILAFYEHLVDRAETYHSIPQWVKPTIFRELLPVFEHRLVKLPRDYGLEQPGSYSELLVSYDQVHGTNFTQQYDPQS